MGQVVQVTQAELPRELRKNKQRIKAAIKRGLRATAEKSVPIVQSRVPVAFGELSESVHAEGSQLVVDAPHAAAVEVGSMPHMPPVEPLIAWAALKGFEDPQSAGWAIAIKISREGTKPRWYARSSLPEIRELLGEQIREALAHLTDGSEPEEDAVAKRRAIGAATGSAAAVAREFGVSASTVRRIREEIHLYGDVRTDSRIRIK